jgi:hypothetical protein
VSKAKVVVNQVLLLENEKFEAHIKVYEVSNNSKFPDGYKVKCALVERNTGALHILLDNHEPFGFHLHSRLPKDKKFRLSLKINHYEEAIKLFFSEVRKVINEK